MNVARFIELLDALDDTDWCAIAKGQALLLVDDEQLGLGPSDAPNVVFNTRGDTEHSVEQLRQAALADAASLLEGYYRTHPLTLTGFNRQVQALIERYGAQAFCARAGDAPKHSLFVEGGEVIAETAESPRHRYGVFCELDRTLADAEAEKQVDQWLRTGDAYERYLSMNVCRYNC